MLHQPAGGPRGLELTLAGPGSDLDIGASGTTHNLLMPHGQKLQLCLAGCDAGLNSVCHASSIASRGFTLLQPVLAGGVPVCLVGHFNTTTGTADVRSGAIDVGANLLTGLYMTDERHVCPRCIASQPGDLPTCDSGANAGDSCQVDAVTTVGDSVYPLSRDCTPSHDEYVPSLDITFSLTSGASTLALPCPSSGPMSCEDCTEGVCAGSACPNRDANGGCLDEKGGVSQSCCAGDPTRPCFSAAVVTRAGIEVSPTPPWPDDGYPKRASGAQLAGTVCTGTTEASILDEASGLPGPAALLMPVTEEWVR